MCSSDLVSTRRCWSSSFRLSSQPQGRTPTLRKWGSIPSRILLSTVAITLRVMSGRREVLRQAGPISSNRDITRSVMTTKKRESIDSQFLRTGASITVGLSPFKSEARNSKQIQSTNIKREVSGSLRVVRISRGNRFPSDRVDLHRLLDQPVDQFSTMSRRSSIETKREFIEVIVQMRSADGPLVCAQQPSFEQRSHAMHARQPRPPAETGLPFPNKVQERRFGTGPHRTIVVRSQAEAWERGIRVSLLFDLTDRSPLTSI